MARTVYHQMIHALDKMSELDVCLHVGPALFDRRLSYLSFPVRFGKSFLDRVPNRCCEFVGERLDVAVGQRAVSGGDGGVDAPCRLDPSEPFMPASKRLNCQRLLYFWSVVRTGAWRKPARN
jgi:hypothetical protein